MAYKGPTVSTTFNGKDKVSKVTKGISKNVKRMATIAGAAIAGIVTGKAAKAINDFAVSGDEIAKTARKIGLSAEALQELRFAADRQGVSSETLTGSLQKLNKNVGDLRAGTGALTTYLNKSNPALAEQLKNVDSNEEAFSLLMDSISQIENPMDRAALAQAAFGRAGQDLIIMAEGGVDGINDLREEARKYGNIISGDAAAASEKYIDSLTNMKASMMALKNKAIAPLIDKIQPLIQKIADYAAANQGIIDQKIQKTFEDIGKAVKVVSKLWDSGLIPAVLAGVGAYIAITKAIAAYKAIVVAAKAAQIALNIAQGASPIGLITIGIAALIGLIVLLVKNWDKVKAAVVNFAVSAKNVISGLLENPFFVAAGLLFAPWLTIPLLIIKNFSKIKEFFAGLWDSILSGFMALWGKIAPIIEIITGAIKKAKEIGGKVIGNASTEGKTNPYRQNGLISRNQGIIESRTSHNSTVDVNLNNLPQGTTTRQRGKAQGVTMNYGYKGGRL